MDGSTMLFYLILVYSMMVNVTFSSDCAPESYYQPYQQLCSLCVPGTYKAYFGNFSCNVCDPGTYSSSSGATSCTKCEAGKYQPYWGTSSCQVCGDGQTTNRIGSISSGECVCSPGNYNRWPWPSCSPCKAGTYKTSAGDTSCTNCLPGTYNTLSGAISCANCETGQYQDLEGQTSCKECDNGTTTLGPGSISSSQCVLGFERKPTSSETIRQDNEVPF